MKKILSISLLLCLCLGLLVSCGKKETPPATGGDTPTTSDTGNKVKLAILETEYAVEDYAAAIAKNNTELLTQVNDALAQLKEDGTLRAIVDKYISNTPHTLQFQQNTEGKPLLIMATNAAFPPYEYYEGDKIVGIDAEIAAAIADKLDRKLQIDHMEFDSVNAAVQAGKADMGLAGMTVNEERLQIVNFSEPYATGIQVVIVPEGSDIKTVSDLTGAQTLIGVQKGTTGDSLAREDFGDDRVKQFANGADAIQALITGKVDCIIIDNEPAKAFVAANNG